MRQLEVGDHMWYKGWMTDQRHVMDHLLRTSQENLRVCGQRWAIVSESPPQSSRVALARFQDALEVVKENLGAAQMLTERIGRRPKVYKDGFDWMFVCPLHDESCYADTWNDAMLYAYGHIAWIHKT